MASLQALLRRAQTLAQGWRRLIGASYRPEKHYMRGPGPKWRAKYARIATRAVGPRAPDASHGGR